MADVAVENPVLNKLQNFFNDALYQKLTQNSARFNVHMRKDRVYRQPYIDGQTGIAQRHCNLFVSEKQRMPGILQGQVYTYPAKRWKSKHRSYLASFMQATKPDVEEHTITTVENPAAIIPPVVVVVEEPPMIPVEKQLKEPWVYYEETAFEEEMEEDYETDEDFEDETYTRKGSKKKKPLVRKQKQVKKKKPTLKAPARLLRSIKKDENDTENKPYVCELCGMRYKTRPGLTYHYAHSHRDEEDGTDPQQANKPPGNVTSADSLAPSDPSQQPSTISSAPEWTESNGLSNGKSNRRPPGPTDGPSTATPVIPPAAPVPSEAPAYVVAEKQADPVKKVSPSPYCDFCLGDSSLNKKTGLSEQLVSCADCGRSGHPSCLQFTDNMMKSVTRYRWQCIECKTCTLCGTSENDDQLLFCDDCDRGYHLYCLTPPLLEPPEGEWSCSLCIEEFHKK